MQVAEQESKNSFKCISRVCIEQRSLRIRNVIAISSFVLHYIERAKPVKAMRYPRTSNFTLFRSSFSPPPFLIESKYHTSNQFPLQTLLSHLHIPFIHSVYKRKPPKHGKQVTLLFTVITSNNKLLRQDGHSRSVTRTHHLQKDPFVSQWSVCLSILASFSSRSKKHTENSCCKSSLLSCLHARCSRIQGAFSASKY